MRIVPLVAVVLLLHHAASAQIPNGGGGDVVRVTPKGEEGGTVATQRNGSSSVTFTVFNDGTGTGSYSFTCSSTGGISCGTVNPIGANILAGGSRDVTVGYSVGGGGGEVHLTASGNTSDQGWYVVTTSPTITIVAPVLTSGSRALVHARQPIIRAMFLAEGSPVGTNAVLKWRGEVVTSLARFNRGLIEWDVDSTRWLGIGDSSLVEVTACAVNGLCNTVTRWAVLLNDNKPVLGFTGMPFEALGRQVGAPFGPGVSVSGAEVESGLSTPAYVSMGAARGAGLVYSTRQSYPRALVPVDLELTWPAGNPDQIKLILWDGATKLDSLVLSSPACATGGTRRCRAVLQGDFSASTFATPTRKWLTVEARVTSGATTQISTDSAEVVLVDRRSTPYGSGWWPAAALKLVGAGDDRLLVGPSGTAAVFRGNGDSLYVAPPGDFSSLVRIGSTWELQPRGSTAKLVFDSNGRLFKALDRNGNRDSIAYSGSSDQVTALFDPVGKSIAFGYDGNGKLSTITDPASRQNKVLINASTNQLTYDSVSSPTTRPYTTTFAYQAYSGTNTVVLTKRIGVITDTTVVTYDSTFKRRPVQVRLPQVQDETGASVNPVIRYTAYERQGFGALRSLDSVYVEMKDPRNNWTRSLLNRWGQARKTWDSLGVIGRSEFTAEGFVRWSEGKVADSSRVYNTYDALNRLARTYIVRAAGDTLRLDSLLYDASHRVIKHIDARGKRDSTAYDGNGNVLVTVSAHNDTTRFWYRSDGLLDSLRAPGTSRRRFAYDSVWKNRAEARQAPDDPDDPDELLLFTRQFDALGRDSVTDGKLKVSIKPIGPCAGGVPCWQWRRTEVFYNAAGQVDSMQQRHTGLCADPCTTPPAPWSSPEKRVGVRFDRAGRDSVRTGETGVRTLYLYDRLGRILVRRPWIDSAAVRDSFVYDVAGNVKKTITRRGDEITTNYDSRNRDTLTVIPSVGTVRRAFGGPLDQLTRLWYDSPVDSIGGVNAELRWGYDQRGRLKADTSYTGTTARVTTHTYDRYERDSLMADPLGTWATRYETDRGIPDTLLTPMGDTVTYTFDTRGRPVGPAVHGGTGPMQTRSPGWTAVGGLFGLSTTVALSPSYRPLDYHSTSFSEGDDEAATPLGPVWYEQRGADAGVDTLRDSVSTNPYGWVTSWTARRNGSLVASESYGHTGSGDLTSAGGDTYTDNSTTGRLTSLATGAGTWSYTYDRAGNLIQAVLGANTWAYGYDALNRLRSVRYNGTLIARYAYDVLGRRIAKRVYSSATGGTVAHTRFVYHGSQVALETDSTGTIGLRYTWGLEVDDLVGVCTAPCNTEANHYYVTVDQLRNVREVTRRDGTWLLSRRFGPYGAQIEEAGAVSFELRYRWTGREYDAETGFYFFRSRYYDVAARRFVQEDPVGYAGGPSLYQYGGGNPLSGRDPDGLLMNFDQYAVKELCLSHLCRGPNVFIDGADVGTSGHWAEVATLSNMLPVDLRWSPLTGLEMGRRLSVYEQAANSALCGAIDCNDIRVRATSSEISALNNSLASTDQGWVVVTYSGFDMRFRTLPEHVANWGRSVRGYNLTGVWEHVGAPSCVFGFCTGLYVLHGGTYAGLDAMGILYATSVFRLFAFVQANIWFLPPLPSLFK